MSKSLENASCLIKSREYHVGFPFRFSHRPANVSSEEIECFHNIAVEAMDSPDDISMDNGRIRKVVFCDGRFLVLGISGYIHAIVSDPENKYNSFCDLSNIRRCYVFAGFVWDMSTCAAEDMPVSFPLLESFEELVKKQIVAHWFDSNNSSWADSIRAGIHMPYNCSVMFEDLPKEESLDGSKLNLTDKQTIMVFPKQEGKRLITEAIQVAWNRKAVSLCTDLIYYREDGSWFMNITSSTCTHGKSSYVNPINIEKNDTSKATATSTEEKGRGRSNLSGLDLDSPPKVKPNDYAYVWLIFENIESVKTEGEIFWNYVRNWLRQKHQIEIKVKFRKSNTHISIDLSKIQFSRKFFSRCRSMYAAFEVCYPSEIPYERLTKCMVEIIQKIEQEETFQSLTGFNIEPLEKKLVTKKETKSSKQKPLLNEEHHTQQLIQKLESQYGNSENKTKKPAEDTSDLFKL